MKILITGGSGFIGMNLIEKLVSTNKHTLLNLDNAEPKIAKHRAYWKACDILDMNQVSESFRSFMPEAVIHLAARTDTDPKNSLADYEALALALARDPVRLQAMRDKLAANLPIAPLFDSERFRRDMETAYRKIWEIARAGEAPRSFSV